MIEKDSYIHIRISNDEKKVIDNYCKCIDLPLSIFVRKAIKKAIKEDYLKN